MKKMGRPLKKNIDIEFLKELRDRGFTLEEISSILGGIPHQTIQYHARTNKIGRFSQYRVKERDIEIYNLMQELHNTTLVAKKLNIAQPTISERYNIYVRNMNLKKERFEWLNNFQNAKDVEND